MHLASYRVLKAKLMICIVVDTNQPNLSSQTSLKITDVQYAMYVLILKNLLCSLNE